LIETVESLIKQYFKNIPNTVEGDLRVCGEAGLLIFIYGFGERFILTRGIGVLED